MFQLQGLCESILKLQNKHSHPFKNFYPSSNKLFASSPKRYCLLQHTVKKKNKVNTDSEVPEYSSRQIIHFSKPRSVISLQSGTSKSPQAEEMCIWHLFELVKERQPVLILIISYSYMPAGSRKVWALTPYLMYFFY